MLLLEDLRSLQLQILLCLVGFLMVVLILGVLQSPTGYTASQTSGSLNVNGAAVSQGITFTVIPSTYSVTFSAIGFTSGPSWSVTFRGSTQSSTGSSIVFTGVPNGGPYSWTLTPPSGYTASLTSGSITVNGGEVSQGITFTAVPSAYSVTFSESGLNSGTSWSVTFRGSTQSSTTNSIVFSGVPNGGPYSWSLTSPTGYTASQTSGSLNVNGAAVSQGITFTAIPSTYSVTFSAIGFTSGPSWSVTFRGSTQSSTGSSIVFTGVPNGGPYSWTLTPPSGYTASLTSGSITVNGGEVSQGITFTTIVNGYSLTFSPPSTSVTRGSGSMTYNIVVTKVSGSPSPVTLSVTNAPAGVSCSFSSNSQSPTFSSTLTVTASSTAALGATTLTVKGTGGGVADQFFTASLSVVESNLFTKTLSIDIVKPLNSTVLGSVPVTYTLRITSNGVSVKDAQVRIFTNDAQCLQLGPALTDSLGFATITAHSTLKIGTKVSWSVEVKKEGYSTITSPKYVFAYSPALAPIVSAALQAIDSQKESLLAAALATDNAMPEPPGLTTIKTCIDLVPGPDLKLFKNKILNSFVDQLPAKIVSEALSQEVNSGHLLGMYDTLVYGDMVENFDNIKKEIMEISMDDALLRGVNNQEFVNNQLSYFTYINSEASSYESAINKIVNQHDEEQFMKDVAFTGVGVVLTVATVGAAPGVLAIIKVAELGTSATGLMFDLGQNDKYKASLLTTIWQAVYDAGFYADSMLCSFKFLRNQISMGSTLPSTSISVGIPNDSGSFSVTVSNNYNKEMKFKVQVLAEAFCPELFNRMVTTSDLYLFNPFIGYSYNAEILVAANSQSTVWVNSNIGDWFDKVKSTFGSNQFTIKYSSTVRVFIEDSSQNDRELALKTASNAASVIYMSTQQNPVSGTQTQTSTSNQQLTITLSEPGHKLYLHVFDSNGNHVGLNRTSNSIDCQIIGATYSDLGQTTKITIPYNVTTLRYEVDALDAESSIETYQVTTAFLNDTKVLSNKTQLGTINVDESQAYLVKISEDANSISVDQQTEFGLIDNQLLSVPIVGGLATLIDPILPGYGLHISIAIVVVLLIVMLMTVFVVLKKRRKLI